MKRFVYLIQIVFINFFSFKENENRVNALLTEIEFLHDLNDQLQRSKEEEIKLLISATYNLKNTIKNVQIGVLESQSPSKTKEFVIPKKSNNLLRERSLNV